MTPGRLAGIGAFVVGGLLLFAVGLFMIGERRLLFEDKVEIYAEFREVAGLQNGAKVRVAGMDAGEVIEIRVPPGPTSRFRVKLSVREDLHNLIRTDSVASIQNDGLVGNKFIQIQTGTEGAPRVAADGTIRSVEPFDLADLLQQASQTVQTVDDTVTKLRGDLEIAIFAVVDTAKEANAVIEDVGADVREIADAGRRITADTQAVISDIRAGKGTLGKFIGDDEFYERARQIARDAERAVQNVRDASEQAKTALTDLRGKTGAADGVMADFRQTLGYAREVMSDMAENAEALKRNWFFRGFFNRRGYFDLNDLTAAEYRRGALEVGDRKPLRIWIGTSPLFETLNGQEVLSEGGKVRLESAMSQFVRYPPTSPLVVEGYATGGTNDERFLRSRQRAELAADYVARKFRLDPQRIGTIPMGDDADGSPNGDTWDGIALTLFVARDVLEQDGREVRTPQRPGTIAHRDN
jgi:phospholipid/cholesterol/gamma-HCH transport system substrate-binding protein